MKILKVLFQQLFSAAATNKFPAKYAPKSTIAFLDAVGKGKVTEDGKVQPLDVKVGDLVIFSKYGGTEIKIDGEEHLIMREDDIMGVVEG